jgi:streptogramin lyase
MNITPLPQHGLMMWDTRIMDRAGRVEFDLTRMRPEVNGRVKDLVLDRSGDAWLATEFGLFHVQVHADVFERILHREHIPEGTGILCRGMAWHQGALYLATEWDGAFVVKEDSGRWMAEERPSPQYLFGAHVDRQGAFWRGGPGVLVREDAVGNVSSHEVPDEIWSILARPDGSVLLGGTKGLHRFDPRTGGSVPLEAPDHPLLRQAHVLQLEPAGDLVMAVSSKGIFVLDQDGKVRAHYHAHADGRFRLPYDDLHHVHFGADGIWWLATRGAGLKRFDPATGELMSFTMRTGFPNNMVYAVYPDDHGQLWLPTDGGLVRFDMETHQTVLFTVRDGLAHDEFNRLAHTRAPDGRLFFGGLNGITVVDPARFTGSLENGKCSLVFTSLLRQMPGGAFEDCSTGLLSSEGITLDPAGNAIQVSFALLSFQAADRMLYAWRIAGLDETWNYTATPSLHLHHLPYGRHVLEVKARNAKGQWIARSIALSIHVRTPLRAQWPIWMTIGVMLSVAAVGGAGLYQARRRCRPAEK